MFNRLLAKVLQPVRALLLVGVAATPAFVATPSSAKNAAEINDHVAVAVTDLKQMNPDAAALFDRAEAVLVIPEVTKASLVVGGAYGEGALLKDGATHSYWSYASASIGFQAGAQQTRQVMFFMTQDALDRFVAKDGFELGADVEATVIDKGAEASLDTTEETAPIIVMVYNREGLLAGASVQGGKYERLNK